MTKKIDLSIIIVNFNTKELLGRCLASIHDSKFIIHDSEIIVVDNDSSDGSAEEIQSASWRIKFKIILNKKNLGFAKANNQGIKKAQGKYILFLNPDTVVPQETITELINYLEQHPFVGAITPRLELRRGQLDPACHRGFPTPWAAFCYFSGLEKLFPKSRIFGQYHQTWKNLRTIHEIDACSGAFLLTRRSIIDQLGGFDEQYFFYGEDLDFCYRLSQTGQKIIFYPKVKAIHCKGVSSGMRPESCDITRADQATHRRAKRAAVEAMEIFYDKFYRQKYPLIITQLIKLAIWFEKRFV